MTDYRVIIVGGGHAGLEAAWAAANLLAHEPRQPAVALVTLDASKIGVMSCNPAIGGLAKGQLVREIDALHGLMGVVADNTGIQFRVLNTSKGAAVHGPRCQSDKIAYAREAQRLIHSRPELDIIEAAVDDLSVDRGRVQGVVITPRSTPCGCRGLSPEGEGHARSASGEGRHDSPRSGAVVPSIDPSSSQSDSEPRLLSAPAVVLTTGTFMRGLMHTGESQTPGGRHSEAPATAISAALARLGFELGRLKTGTPPRLKRSTIDWNSLDPQFGDPDPLPFSDLTDRATFPALDQVECRVTRTNETIHDAIRANLHRAPMFTGQIDGAGPRYCPSIEDKVVRFADRTSHHVFLEPESHHSDWVYANGVSSSLPADAQDVIVRNLPGCERAEILRYGYAVEYDMVRPHQILPTGMTKSVEGLFLAGQINGTSGYEEAAAQGVIAGVNAARFSSGDGEFTLGRNESYIGVLMDDLVTRTPTEPYRMFTSRAEHRLVLRADNAADRLTPIAERLGLLAATDAGARRAARFANRSRALEAAATTCQRTRIDDRTLADHCRRTEFTPEHLAAALRDATGAFRDPAVVRTLHANFRYESYIVRAAAEARRHAEMSRRRIPAPFFDGPLDSFRNETREALRRFRPPTFGVASRLEGVTPADLTLLSVLVERFRRTGGEPGRAA